MPTYPFAVGFSGQFAARRAVLAPPSGAGRGPLSSLLRTRSGWWLLVDYSIIYVSVYIRL